MLAVTPLEVRSLSTGNCRMPRGGCESVIRVGFNVGCNLVTGPLTRQPLPLDPIPRDELNRKMDYKRQEISDNQQSLRQLEESVHKLKEEKVYNLK